MSDLATCGSSLAWHGCYQVEADLCTPESYAHPAICDIIGAWRENIKSYFPLALNVGDLKAPGVKSALSVLQSEGPL